MGVAAQYTGTAGKIANSQTGVFFAYATRYGAVLLDRELYVHADWEKMYITFEILIEYYPALGRKSSGLSVYGDTPKAGPKSPVLTESCAALCWSAREMISIVLSRSR